MHNAFWTVEMILVGTALLSGHLAWYLSMNRRGMKSAFYMGFLMWGSAWWAAFNALEYLAPSLLGKLILANLQYLAIAAIPVLWYALGAALDTEERRGFGRDPHPVMWVLPALTALFVWMDPWWALVRTDVRLGVQGPFSVILKEFGPWFWIHSAFSYLCVLWGTVLILRGVGVRGGPGRGAGRKHGERRNKVQLFLLVAGTLLPTGVNFIYILGLLPTGSLDPTPLAFSITGLLLVLNLTRFRFLSLVSVAREAAVEHLRHAVLILDRDSRLAYANAVAREAFGIDARCVGKHLTEMGPYLVELGNLKPGEERELSIAGVPGLVSDQLFEARAGIIEQKKRRIGQVITLYNITRRVEAEEALKRVNQGLEERIQERTEALEKSNKLLSGELEHRTRTERQLQYSILHDALTGLANRSLLLSRLDQALAHYHRDPTNFYGLLYLDFDGFKSVNDSYGHEAGDAFLREVASRLTRCMREVDTIARFGGDEFAILLDGVGGPSDVELAAERIAEELSVPISLGQNAVIPSASIGVLFARDDVTSAQEALRDADIAMYKAKLDGKNRRVLFQDEMRIRVQERLHLTNDLRSAISSGGISLAFQPIVRMDAVVVGWEVLARWNHPERGPVSPERFIPLAEESGLIVPLGTWVLLETLKIARDLLVAGRLQDNSHGDKPYFAVNVSAIQLNQPDFAELVLSSLDRLELPRSILNLELTESAIIENRDGVTSILHELSSKGVAFKLDDFGTGYSSLGYLDRIPIDSVKIDRSFIDRMTPTHEGILASAGIVRGIISLSHELGKTVVAEGMETKEQVGLLTKYGCDFAQGYFFGRPMTVEQLQLSLSPDRVE